MTHVKGRLGAYVTGELGPDESETIRVHLESCAECRLAHEDARFEVLLHEATLPPEVSGSLWPGVAERLHAPAARPFSLRLAGGMAFAAAMGIFLSLTIPTPPPTGSGDTDLWSTLDYGLVDGDPVTLSVFDPGSSQ